MAVLPEDRTTVRDQPSTGPIPWRLCVGWGLGAVTMGMMANVFNVLILPFATERLGIAPALAGAVLALSKLYDGFFDPVVGTFSDNLETRIGRRRPVLMAATLICPASVLFLFFAPELTGGWNVAYYVVAAILLSTAYATWTVPYLAMSAEMTDDYHDRSRLITNRVIGGALGLIVGSLCGASILNAYGGGAAAYHRMALVTAAAVLAISALFLFMTRDARFSTRTERQSFSLLRQARLVVASKPLFLLVSAKGWWYLNVAASQAALVYVLKYIAQKPTGWLTYYFFALTLGMMGAQKLWLELSRRFDKKPTFIAACVIYGLSMFSWLVCGPDEHVAVFIVRAVLIGASSGGVLMLLLSMYNDAIEADYVVSGVRREGAFAGIYALVEKVFTAVGVAGAGMLLGLMGYAASTTGGAEQPASALVAMQLSIAIIPLLSVIAVIVIMTFYRLDPAAIAPAPRSADR